MSSMRFETGQNEYQPVDGQIVWIEDFTAEDRLFVIDMPEGEDLGHDPGQFVQVFLPGVGEAPFSISSSPTKEGPFELCVRAVGSVTNAMHDLEVGDQIGIRGPYGSGFDPDRLAGDDLLFVAGGIGLAPLRSMINYALDEREQFGDLTAVYGCVHPDQTLFDRDLDRWRDDPGLDLHRTVDECPDEATWDGDVGLVTDIIPDLDVDPATTTALVCGPPVMYQFVLEELDALGIPDERIFLSLERNMHCGRGLCGHCQINELYVCLDGPVFHYPKVRDKEEAEL
ncbi:MAG: FAD/NAD(P)-binding protein [Halococcoides sp.]